MSDLKWEPPGQRQQREQGRDQTISELYRLLADQEQTDRRRFWISTTLSILALLASIVAAAAGVIACLH